MILSDEDQKEYEREIAALKAKYSGKVNIAYRRESSQLGWKYKQLELHDGDTPKMCDCCGCIVQDKEGGL